jgi:hypothetical protein
MRCHGGKRDMKLMEIQCIVDTNGQLVIPEQFTRDMGIAPGDIVMITNVINTGSDMNTDKDLVLTRDTIAVDVKWDNEMTLPYRLLEEAEIPVQSELDIVCVEGAIVIMQTDILDSLPDDLRGLFKDLGINPDTIREVMRNGGFEYEQGKAGL